MDCLRLRLKRHVKHFPRSPICIHKSHEVIDSSRPLQDQVVDRGQGTWTTRSSCGATRARCERASRGTSTCRLRCQGCRVPARRGRRPEAERPSSGSVLRMAGRYRVRAQSSSSICSRARFLLRVPGWRNTINTAHESSWSSRARRSRRPPTRRARPRSSARRRPRRAAARARRRAAPSTCPQSRRGGRRAACRRRRPRAAGGERPSRRRGRAAPPRSARGQRSRGARSPRHWRRAGDCAGDSAPPVSLFVGWGSGQRRGAWSPEIARDRPRSHGAARDRPRSRCLGISRARRGGWAGSEGAEVISAVDRSVGAREPDL